MLARRMMLKIRRLVTTEAEGALLGPELVDAFAAWVITGANASNYFQNLGNGTYRLVSDGALIYAKVSMVNPENKRLRYQLTKISGTGNVAFAAPTVSGDISSPVLIELDTTRNTVQIKRMNACDLIFTASAREVIPTWV